MNMIRRFANRLLYRFRMFAEQRRVSATINSNVPMAVRVLECPSLEESRDPLYETSRLWPEWWKDEFRVRELLKEYPKCTMLERIGMTCRQSDPDGPPSCRCMNCNLNDITEGKWP